MLSLTLLPMADSVSNYYLRVDTSPGTEAVQVVLQALRSVGIGVQLHGCIEHASKAPRQAVVVLTRTMADGVLRQALAKLLGSIGHARAICVAQLD